MKLHKPIFSVFIIIIQLIFSLNDYYQLQQWKKANPEIDSIINLVRHYDTLFLFVLIIGIFEILTSPGWLKNLMRIFLICIVFGYHFSGLIPIKGFKFGVYNTAWFAAVVTVILILVKIGKNLTRKNSDEKLI